MQWSECRIGNVNQCWQSAQMSLEFYSPVINLCLMFTHSTWKEREHKSLQTCKRFAEKWAEIIELWPNFLKLLFFFFSSHCHFCWTRDHNHFPVKKYTQDRANFYLNKCFRFLATVCSNILPARFDGTNGRSHSLFNPELHALQSINRASKLHWTAPKHWWSQPIKLNRDAMDAPQNAATPMLPKTYAAQDKWPYPTFQTVDLWVAERRENGWPCIAQKTYSLAVITILLLYRMLNKCVKKKQRQETHNQCYSERGTVQNTHNREQELRSLSSPVFTL